MTYRPSGSPRRPSQIGALDELLRGSSSAAVLVNAEWDPAMLPAASRALVRPFKTVYAYQVPWSLFATFIGHLFVCTAP